jgi:hypothetical protein
LNRETLKKSKLSLMLSWFLHFPCFFCYVYFFICLVYHGFLIFHASSVMSISSFSLFLHLLRKPLWSQFLHFPHRFFICWENYYSPCFMLFTVSSFAPSFLHLLGSYHKPCAIINISNKI